MLKKRVGLLRKRQDLSFTDFNQHWATSHAALVANLPGVLGYVQNPVIKSWLGPQREQIDGMIEVWFDGTTVASPDKHTSAEQRDDELRFLEAFTAFTVTNLETYNAEAKVWVLLDPGADAESLLDTVDRDVLDLAVLRRTEPEPGARLMERPQLKREAAPPSDILVLGCDLDAVDRVYNAVIEAASSSPAPDAMRVLLTHSRRIV